MKSSKPMSPGLLHIPSTLTDQGSGLNGPAFSAGSLYGLGAELVFGVAASGVLLFTLSLGSLVDQVGYQPFFILLGLLDLAGAALLWTLVRKPA